MNRLIALLCGLLFGAGLVVSDMVNPARVLAFLDVAGHWDPALVFVMGSALVPSALAYAWRRRRQRSLAADTFHVPDNRRIDARLLGGAVLFGVGWAWSVSARGLRSPHSSRCSCRFSDLPPPCSPAWSFIARCTRVPPDPEGDCDALRQTR